MFVGKVHIWNSMQLCTYEGNSVCCAIWGCKHRRECSFMKCILFIYFRVHNRIALSHTELRTFLLWTRAHAVSNSCMLGSTQPLLIITCTATHPCMAFKSPSNLWHSIAFIECHFPPIGSPQTKRGRSQGALQANGKRQTCAQGVPIDSPYSSFAHPQGLTQS